MTSIPPGLQNPKPLFDTGLTRSIRYRCQSYAKAIHARQRFNAWRVKYHRLEAERLGEVPGIAPPAPYEGVKLSLALPSGLAVTKPHEAPLGSPVDVVFSPLGDMGYVVDEVEESSSPAPDPDDLPDEVPDISGLFEPE
jgi:hypothetical protein